MMNRNFRGRSLIFASLAFIAVLVGPPRLGAAEGSRWRLDLEGGGVFSGYNNIAIPGDTGTRFSLSEDFKTDAGFYYRLRLTWRLGARHSLSVLYAPLKLSASGTAKFPVHFFGVDFPAGAAVSGTFMFNSYRLTYRYEIVNTDAWKVGLGFTAKIRDAAIGLEGGGLAAKKTNVGFVPLLNARVERRLSSKLNLLFEADALAAPQGRAEDVLFAALYRISPSLTLKAGYRFVEGGADNDVVYNFTFIHYASIGLLIDF